MKTLVLTQNFPPSKGGSGRWFWELYSRLGTEFEIAAGLAPQSDEFDAQAEMNIHRIDLYSPQWGIKSLTGLAFYWRSYWQVRKLIKQRNIQRLHCGRVLPEGLIAWLINKTMGIPYACYVHGEDLEASALSGELTMLSKLVMKSAEQIVCNSENSARITRQMDASVDDKIVVLHPGADTEYFVPLEERDEAFIDSMGWRERKVILTVGRLQMRKGQDMMIKAMHEISAQVPNALYVVVGNGETKEMLHELVANSELEESVQFVHDIDDDGLRKCYQHCDLFILPNRTEGQDIEGFGMVLVEAQSCEKPVIAGDSGGTAETMKIGETGFIVDATSKSALTEVICSLLSDQERCRAMGRLGRSHVVAAFDWKAVTERGALIFAATNKSNKG